MKFDRLVRAVANQKGRGRMKQDMTFQKSEWPRCAPIFTGEFLPTESKSCISRTISYEVRLGEINLDVIKQCAVDAKNGVYEQVMGAFVRWLAADGRRAHYQSMLSARADEWQNKEKWDHDTPAESVGHLNVGLEAFCDYLRHIDIDE